MQYQLNIDIDQNGLTSIYNAGQVVTLVKSVVSAPLGGGNLPIAWVTFQPFLNNSVSWIENYNLYATTTSLQAGATIKQTSVTGVPVMTGWTYTFDKGQFTGAQGGGAGTYNMTNQQHGMFSFGLSQEAIVNNVTVNAPLNAIPVLFNEAATFTPEEKVSIFLTNVLNNGVVLSQVASNALSITLTSQSPTANIGFNDATNVFFQESAKLQDSFSLVRKLGRF